MREEKREAGRKVFLECGPDKRAPVLRSDFRRVLVSPAVDPDSVAQILTDPPYLREDRSLDGELKGSLVVDPFTGSSTTGVACKRPNRRFVGCDLDSSSTPRNVNTNGLHLLVGRSRGLALQDGGLHRSVHIR